MLVIGAGLLSGCVQSAAVPANLHAGYLFDGRECSPIVKLQAVPVSVDEEFSVPLGPKSACVTLGKGLNEPAYLMKLPYLSTAYYITVHTRRSRLMLVPSVELLNGLRRKVRMFSYKDMKPVGNGLSLTVFIRPGTQHDRYILLYPDPALTGDSSKHLTQGKSVADIYYFAIQYGTSAQTTTVDVEQGRLTVNVVKYSPVNIHSSRGSN